MYILRFRWQEAPRLSLRWIWKDGVRFAIVGDDFGEELEEIRRK